MYISERVVHQDLIFTPEQIGEHILKIQVENTLNVVLNLPAQTSGLLFLDVEGSGELNLIINVAETANWSYLWINQSNEEISVNEIINIEKNANFTANYGEFNHGKHHKKTIFNLNGENSSLNVQGATVSFNNLEWQMQALHNAKHTYSMLKNYGVIFKNAKLSFYVLGHILKGNNGSSAHQITRILNMNDGKMAKVYPQLVIDENDVSASHAASVGQIDPEMIYYLQSRGIKYDQVVRLITLGYLTPIITIIENEKVKEKLLQVIEKCVNN